MVLEKEKDKTSNTCFNTDISDKPQMQVKRILDGHLKSNESRMSNNRLRLTKIGFLQLGFCSLSKYYVNAKTGQLIYIFS